MATIRKRGAKWQVQIRRVGFPSVTRSFLIRKDAEAWARQTEVQADRSELPSDPKILHRITLGQLVERYRDTVSPKKRGYEVERIVLTAFLRHPICRKPLSHIRTEDFATYRDERLKTISMTSLKRQLSPLHNLFEVARDEWGLPLPENPLGKLRLSASQRRRERRLNEGELDRLMAAAGSCRNPLIVPIILFAVATGMRRGEILNVRWDHIDREGRSLLIPHTKNGHSRTLPLMRETTEVLDTLSEMGDWVFPMSGNAFRLAWDRLRARAGLADLHFHDLRHEAISRFFERGLTVPEVALISGHRDPRMLFRYAHPMRCKIIEKLDC
ncbi:shufflon-specific DNA recombinase [Methyloceanibacter superfactus]|uniref:Shufflon-specific DNA recombinase n=2 Tax=Methyloceanibacter superfactus TaxID=1774969 RepID=A0A1E3VSZ3_9HYPH|nr:shufflon-specific DNA recombinase [Methyloceanibacter superfactus]